MTSQAQFLPLPFEHLDPDVQLVQSKAFLERMKTRRTVRDFSTKAVPFELIQNAIATAGTAPSGANQQPWTFVVIQDPSIKHQIRMAAEAEERESYAHRMSQEWLDAISHLGTDWQKPHLEDAPYLIAVFAQSYGIEHNDAGEEIKIKHYYVTESVGIAVGMLLASLHLAGLATLTHTPSPMRFLTDILGRPAHERPFVLIPVGYPAQDAHVPVISKKPLDSIMIVLNAK